MATIVTGLACSLSLQSAAYLQGLQAAAMATTTAAAKMQAAFGRTTQAAALTTAAVQRQAAAAVAANRATGASFMTLGRQVTGAVNGFKSLFAIGAIIAASKALARYSDDWKEATNKIAAAEQISGRQSRSLQAINDIARNSRTSLEDTADLYAKLLRVTADVATSEQQVADATNIVNMAFKAGGASTLEQVNGIRQLAQALGSGILQGDELRSIRENAPLLAKAIADEFGTTVAGLKQLGAEGKLTSDRIFQAILNAQSGIKSAFDKTTPTIAQAGIVLKNSLEQAIGAFNEATGASNILAAAIMGVADAIDAVSSSGPVVVDVPETEWQRFMGNITGFLNEVDRLEKQSAARSGATLKQFVQNSVDTSKELGLQGTDVLREFNDVLDAIGFSYRDIVPAQKTYIESIQDLSTKAGQGIWTFNDFTGSLTLAKDQLQALADAAKSMPAFIPPKVPNSSDQGLSQSVGGFKPDETFVADVGAITFEKSRKELKLLDDEFAAHRALIKDIGTPLEKVSEEITKIGESSMSTEDKLRAVDQALKDFNKTASDKAIATHAQFLSAVGTPMEKYKEQLAEVARTEGLTNDEITRLNDGAFQDYLDNLDKQQTSLGLVLTPMQEYNAATRDINAQLVDGEQKTLALANAHLKLMESQQAIANNMGLVTSPLEEYRLTLEKIAIAEATTAQGAELAFSARAAATAKFAESSLAAFAALTGALAGLFKENKAIAIANAIVSTAEGIAGSLKLLPSPLAWVYAAAAAVTGAAQISTILSTQPGSSKKPTAMTSTAKGSASASASAGAASTSSSSKRTPSQTVNITVQGESGFSAEQVRELIGHINEAVGDGVHLRVM